MRLVRCDNCGETRSVDAFWDSPGEWRTITVRRRPENRASRDLGFSPNLIGGEKESMWPGRAFWPTNFVPTPDAKIELCSEECLIDGLKKLHRGARVVDFTGFTLAPEALHACIQVQAQIAAEREP